MFFILVHLKLFKTYDILFLFYFIAQRNIQQRNLQKHSWKNTLREGKREYSIKRAGF